MDDEKLAESPRKPGFFPSAFCAPVLADGGSVAARVRDLMGANLVLAGHDILYEDARQRILTEVRKIR